VTAPDLFLVLALACGADAAPPIDDALAPCATLDRQAPAGSGAAPTQASPPAAAATPRPQEIWRSITIGVGFNHNYPSGEFVQFAIWKPYKQGITIDFGERHNDDESSVGLGVRYWRQLDAKTILSIDGATGSEPFAAKYGVGGSINRSVAGVGVTLGAGYREWWDGNYSTDVALGLQKWFPHVIVGGGAAYSQGEPASFTGWRGNVGLTYYTWKKIYAGVSYDFGTVNNRDWLYDTRSRGFNAGFSWWSTSTSGININGGYGLDNEIYGVSVSWFKEW
jgi:hypothetical protein